MSSAEGVVAYRQELHIAPGEVVALYSGNMGAKQGLEVLADVARLLAQEARPVVATAHPGTDLTTVVQTCCLVAPPENAAAWAPAIQTLAADPALHESLGAAGYLYAQAHLDSGAVLG